MPKKFTVTESVTIMRDSIDTPIILARAIDDCISHAVGRFGTTDLNIEAVTVTPIPGVDCTILVVNLVAGKEV